MPVVKASFAYGVKEEIARKDWSDECKRSILSAFLKINGGLRISGGKEEIELSSESATTAKALYSYISSLYGVNVHFAYTKGIGARKGVKYHVLIDEADYLLGDLEVDFFAYKVPKNAVINDELTAAYLAGAFLCSGSVNDPKTSNYHLEFSFQDENYAKWFAKLLGKTKGGRFSAKLAKRRNRHIVYLKRSDEISELLAYMGAYESCLKFENIRVDRDFQNLDNRLYNIDSANMAKTIKASQRQLEEIEYFRDNVGLENIPNLKLRSLMKLRLEHPDASLDELARLLSEELASTVSKSNVNHLFRHLHQEYLKHHG
ncbi:MAG: DNA-binding protein WhiA [Bacillota bacterium]|nr:DNA-binding protein WhiA [Bacillota bacterium]